MKKEFIPYELALRMKELGFDEVCLAYYDGWNGESHLIITNESGSFLSRLFRLFRKEECDTYNQSYVEYLIGICTAPTFSQVFRWFREKYVLLGFIEPANGYEDKSLFAFYICDDEQNIINDEHSYSKDSSLHFKTYEEAELACLDKLIEIIESKSE